jgi:hypothetical protein
VKDLERDYVLQVLLQRKAQLELIGPATDRPDLARWQVRAIERMMERLQRPRLPINPFI